MKYTKLERNWVMYDVGNSALVLLNTSVVPIYFNAINTGASSADLVVAWGNAQTIASLVIAMLMPILGALADYAGNKIKFFLGFFLTGLVLCLVQAIPMSAMAFLTVYVLCTIGLNSSMTFYDAMLPDITTDERMDAVSSSGYAWGYIGSTVPFVICLALIMGGPASLVMGTDVEKPAASIAVVDSGVEVFVVLEGKVDLSAEKARLEKEIAAAQKELAGCEKTLANEGFVAKAAPAVVQKKRDRAAELKEILAALTAQVADFS